MAQVSEATKRDELKIKIAAIDDLLEVIPGFSSTWWLLGTPQPHPYIGQAGNASGTFRFIRTHASVASQIPGYLGYTLSFEKLNLTSVAKELYVWVYNPTNDADINLQAVLDNLRDLRRDPNTTSAQRTLTGPA